MNDKITIVTGDPRSGTSMMMQTLNFLGVPIAGEEFPGDKRLEMSVNREKTKFKSDLDEGVIQQEEYDNLIEEIDKKNGLRKKKMKDMNPGGFFEIPGVVMRGLKEVGEHGGKVVKIVSPGAYPHHGGQGTPAEIVDKYILCLRDPKSVAQSQTRLTRLDPQLVGQEDLEWNINPTRYLFENGGLAEYLVNLSDRSQWLVVDYDEFVSDPKTTIDKIIQHLQITPTEEQKNKAIGNIRVDLNRSKKKFPGWGNQEIRGMMAENLYQSIKEEKYESLLSVVQQIPVEKQKERLENTRWYDLNYGLIAVAQWHRDAAELSELRDSRREQFCKEVKRGMHPMTDPSFEESTEEYTIERPADFGPLTRKKVYYDGEELTLEQAFHVHQQKWTQGKAERDADRVIQLLKQING